MGTILVCHGLLLLNWFHYVRGYIFGIGKLALAIWGIENDSEDYTLLLVEWRSYAGRIH